MTCPNLFAQNQLGVSHSLTTLTLSVAKTMRNRLKHYNKVTLNGSSFEYTISLLVYYLVAVTLSVIAHSNSVPWALCKVCDDEGSHQSI